MSTIISDQLSSGLAGSGSRGGSQKHAVRKYDFREPEGFDRSHLRSLHSAFDVFVRLAGGSLTGALRTPVHVRVRDIRQSTWEEFAKAAESPSHLVVFNLSPLPGKAILYVPLALAMAVVDMRLSGTGIGDFPVRPLTEIEDVLVSTVTDDLIGELVNALAPYLMVSPSVSQKASDTDLLQAVIPSGVCAVAEFEVRIGEGEPFRAAICAPYQFVRPIVEAIERKDVLARGSEDDKDSALLPSLLGVALPVSIQFQGVKLTPLEVASLTSGDVIPLKHRPDRPLTMTVGGERCFSVIPTKVRRRLAALIVDSEKRRQRDQSQ